MKAWQNNLKKFIEKQGEETLSKKANEVSLTAKSIAPVLSGDLRESRHVEKVSKSHVKIGSDLHYAIYQELGTRYISPRAYLRTALRRVIR